MGRRDIVPNIKFFMPGEGEAAIARDDPEPGSYVERRAEMNVMAVVSNCPRQQSVQRFSSDIDPGHRLQSVIQH
jgi:uncharacterized protein YcgI (DUF1989 family)